MPIKRGQTSRAQLRPMTATKVQWELGMQIGTWPSVGCMQPFPLRIKLYQTSTSARKNTFPLGACIYAIIITFCLIAFPLFLAKAIRAGFLPSRLEMALCEVQAKAKQRCVFCTSDRTLHSRVKLLMMPAARKTVSDSARPDSRKCTVQIGT